MGNCENFIESLSRAEDTISQAGTLAPPVLRLRIVQPYDSNRKSTYCCLLHTDAHSRGKKSFSCECER
jgi:hypothetical protein